MLIQTFWTGNKPLIWAKSSLAVYIKDKEGHLFFFVYSLFLSPAMKFFSQALEPTSLGLQSLEKTRWGIQPCALKNNWILGSSIRREPLMDKLDHNLYPNKSSSLTSSFYQLFSSRDPFTLLLSDPDILCVWWQCYSLNLKFTHLSRLFSQQITMTWLSSPSLE